MTVAVAVASSAVSNGKAPRITVRPATVADIEAFPRKDRSQIVPTLKGWVAEVDGKTVGLGGLASGSGRWIAFLDLTEQGRELVAAHMFARLALVRAARMVLDDARAQGIRFVYADADTTRPRAAELLERLGFEFDVRSDRFYRWSAI